MSNIIKSKDDLILVKDMFDVLIKDDISASLLEEIVKNLIPRNMDDKLFFDYKIYEKGFGIAGAFDSKREILVLSVDEIHQWVYKEGEMFIDILNIKNSELFKKYLKLLIISHEIEHGYQYLMANKMIDAPCNLVSDGYKLIFDTVVPKNIKYFHIIKEFKRLISFILYRINQGKYVIERNANVEATDLLSDLAMENGHDEMVRVFNEMMNNQAAYGYYENNRGSFEETCDRILLGDEYRKLDHNYDLSLIERVRYGLPISEEKRNNRLVRMR